MKRVAFSAVALALSVTGSGCHSPSKTASGPWRVVASTMVIGIGSEAQPAKALWVSGDGRAVAGYAFKPGYNQRDPHNVVLDGSGPGDSFRWTLATGLNVIKVPAGSNARISAISADGAVLAGAYCDGARNGQLFRWTEAGGFEEIGGLGPGRGMQCLASATAVVAGGSMIYGAYPDGERGSFRWTRSGGVRSMHIPGEVTAASADGSVVTGIRFTGGGERLFLWSLARGFEDLGVPPGAATGDGTYVSPNAISADGSTVVGEYEFATAHHTRAFRWTRRGGFQVLAGEHAEAAGVSGDGSKIVGALWSAKGPHAVQWVGDSPPQPVGPPVLNALKAKGISADGRTIIATGASGSGEIRSFVISVK